MRASALNLAPILKSQVGLVTDGGVFFGKFFFSLIKSTKFESQGTILMQKFQASLNNSTVKKVAPNKLTNTKQNVESSVANISYYNVKKTIYRQKGEYWLSKGGS